MKRFKVSIIATVIAMLCIGQHIAAEYSIINESDRKWNIQINKETKPYSEQRSLKPNESWSFDKQQHDNVKWVKVILPYHSSVEASKDLSSNWKTIIIKNGAPGRTVIEERS